MEGRVQGLPRSAGPWPRPLLIPFAPCGGSPCGVWRPGTSRGFQGCRMPGLALLPLAACVAPACWQQQCRAVVWHTVWSSCSLLACPCWPACSCRPTCCPGGSCCATRWGMPTQMPSSRPTGRAGCCQPQHRCTGRVPAVRCTPVSLAWLAPLAPAACVELPQGSCMAVECALLVGRNRLHALGLGRGCLAEQLAQQHTCWW